MGVVYLVAGLLSGYLADRFGRSLIMRIGLWLYLGGSMVAVLMDELQVGFGFLPIFGLGGPS